MTEKQIIIKALASKKHMKEIAKDLGISQSTLYNRIIELKISTNRKRGRKKGYRKLVNPQTNLKKPLIMEQKQILDLTEKLQEECHEQTKSPD